MNPFDVALFAAAVRLAVPLNFTAIGALISERAGVLNLGLEGMMLFGAYAGFVATHATGNIWLGVLSGIAAGALTGIIMAAVAVSLRGDQVVVGVAINLLAAGITLFLFRLQFQGVAPTTERMNAYAVPVLSDIPAIGQILFNQVPLTYVAYILAPLAAYLLFRTRWGLVIRSSGELPDATESAGTSVLQVQWLTLMVTGALAGLGGAYLSVGQLGFFAENMTAGRGFLALAAVAFGHWRPYGVLLACIIFGFTDALQLRLQSIDTLPRSVWIAIAIVAAAGLTYALQRRSVAGRGHLSSITLTVFVIAIAVTGAFALPGGKLPSQFWLSLPYVLSLAALASTSRSVRAPAMVGRPFRPDG